MVVTRTDFEWFCSKQRSFSETFCGIIMSAFCCPLYKSSVNGKRKTVLLYSTRRVLYHRLNELASLGSYNFQSWRNKSFSQKVFSYLRVSSPYIVCIQLCQHTSQRHKFSDTRQNKFQKINSPLSLSPHNIHPGTPRMSSRNLKLSVHTSVSVLAGKQEKFKNFSVFFFISDKGIVCGCGKRKFRFGLFSV